MDATVPGGASVPVAWQRTEDPKHFPELDAWCAAAGPPLALQMTKRMLSNSLSLSLSEALSAEAAAQTVNFGSQDTREGVLAFLEKRDPVYRGR